MAGTNCSAIESWAERPTFVETQSWISEGFSRQNEALTKALQVSLSDESSASETLSYFLPPICAAAARDRGSGSARSAISGKIAKRKSRASKRTPTTYINADPANFRRMVQEVTGIGIGEAKMQAEPVLWHEPEWSSAYLPTLDTSALLLDHGGPAIAGYRSFLRPPPASETPATSFIDLESFPSFPTLESWGAM